MFRKFILMIAIALTELAIIAFVFPLIPIQIGELETKLLSVMLANWFLVCFWLSVGSTKAPYRQLICTGILGVVGLIAAVYDSQPTTSIARGLNFIATSWYPYAVFYIPRRVAGMKLIFLNQEHATDQKRQFGIGALLGFMAVLSVPLALTRFAHAIHPQTVQPQAISESFMLLCMLGIVSVTVLPLGIAAFANRGATLKISLALLWCIIATLGVDQFVPRPYEGGGPIFVLTWGQIALVFFTARLLSVRWESGQVLNETTSSGVRFLAADQLRPEMAQGFVIASALALGCLLVFAPIVLQFLVFYTFAAATPAFILLAHFWRRATPNRFWAAFLFAGALPWAYSMFASTQELWTLLFGTPDFASTSPVEVIPTSGINWADLLVLLLAPLVIGAASGVFAISIPPTYARIRSKFDKRHTLKTTELRIGAEK